MRITALFPALAFLAFLANCTSHGVECKMTQKTVNGVVVEDTASCTNW